MVQSIGTLYDGLAVERGRAVMLEPITFLLRRLVLATLVIYGSKIFFVQMMLLILLNLFVIIITYSTRSLASKSMLNLQTVGEITTLITVDFFLIFRVVTVEDNWVLGYSTIGFIAIYVVVCTAYILWDSIAYSRSSLIRFLAMRKYKVQRENLGIILHATRRQRIKNFLMRRNLANFDENMAKSSVEMGANVDLNDLSSLSAESQNSNTWETCSDDSNLEERESHVCSENTPSRSDSAHRSSQGQAVGKSSTVFALRSQKFLEQLGGNALLNGKSIAVSSSKDESAMLPSVEED